LKAEKLNHTENLLKLQNDVTSSRIDDLQHKVDVMSDTIMRMNLNLDHVSKQTKEQATKNKALQDQMDEQERDIKFSIKQLKEQVTALQKKSKWHYGLLGADASDATEVSTLSALLERL
jgi:predicted  nucleic acid-binding Zn-ribbon protein